MFNNIVFLNSSKLETNYNELKNNENNFSLNINMPDINFSGKTTLNIFIKGFLVYRNKLIFSNFKIYNINKYIK
ncbi:hypothetical protein [Geotoga petraea]|uniref:Uncharacterized protein n=1 Tax=Geotoga petraea TaxID=28234 RepID=A0A4Z0W1U9_9BACT|nr:hypothetical protein [Geotoga petraea]TGG86781.1 hypothetical protein E4650_09845 [Geotoga petraea]